MQASLPDIGYLLCPQSSCPVSTWFCFFPAQPFRIASRNISEIITNSGFFWRYLKTLFARSLFIQCDFHVIGNLQIITIFDDEDDDDDEFAPRCSNSRDAATR